MHQARHKHNSAVAFVAALLFVLQPVLTAWASSPAPATPMPDAFGNPLCITSADHGGGAPAGDHSRMPDCCLFGCNLVSPLLAAAPDDGMGLLRPLVRSVVLLSAHRTILVQTPDHDPGSPRAPPLTA